MKTIYESHYCSLHVRVSNRPALTLYRDILGYEILKVEEEYYADKEDAYDMALFFNETTRAKIKKDKAHKEIKEIEESKGEETHSHTHDDSCSHETKA